MASQVVTGIVQSPCVHMCSIAVEQSSIALNEAKELLECDGTDVIDQGDSQDQPPVLPNCSQWQRLFETSRHVFQMGSVELRKRDGKGIAMGGGK